MDEDEYEEYLRQISDLRESEVFRDHSREQLRDEEGLRVQGCYVVRPKPTI